MCRAAEQPQPPAAFFQKRVSTHGAQVPEIAQLACEKLIAFYFILYLHIATLAG